MRGRRFVLLAAVGLVFAVLAPRAEARPDYLKRYQAGLQAIEREEWDRAVELPGHALGEPPASARR
ncbi:MAG: hypothetical protein AAFY88_21830, partial [Acidobacteriota bacterium]